MEHELKIWPEFFEDVRLGIKPFELRKDDRPYQPGDTLRLREWDPERYKRVIFDGMTEEQKEKRKEVGYTGRELRNIRITLVLRNEAYLQPGIVALGLCNQPGCHFLGDYIDGKEV